MIDHVEVKHIENLEGFDCPVCTKNCPNRKSLKNHLYNAHKKYMPTTPF